MSSERFNELFNESQSDLFLFARKLSGSSEPAKDLLQDTAMKAYLNRHKLNDNSSFKSWAASILYNIYISDYRKRKRRKALLTETGMHSDAFFTRVESCNMGLENLKKDDIIRFCHIAGAHNFRAFSMYSKGFSYKEIAENEGIPVGTVKSRIHTTRARIKQVMKSLGLYSPEY